MFEVEIFLDKKRHLKLTLNSMVKFQEITGKNLLSGFDAAGMSAADFRALLWSCLISEDSSLTLEQVGELVTPANLQMVAAKIGAAWSAAIPEGEDSPKNPQSRPTG